MDLADSPLVTAGCAVLSSSLMVEDVFPSSTFWSINSLIPGMEFSTAIAHTGLSVCSGKRGDEALLRRLFKLYLHRICRITERDKPAYTLCLLSVHTIPHPFWYIQILFCMWLSLQPPSGGGLPRIHIRIAIRSRISYDKVFM